MEKMRAIVITEPGGPDVLKPTIVPVPIPKSNHVLIRVRAFGLNHAESYFRSGAWGDVAKITGIECVGEVIDPLAAPLERGQRVFAILGGMGRSLSGSYAEYASVPSSNVIPFESDLSWTELAALPESYATAWALLDRNLEIKPGQTLLVRGGTSALGQAIINIAKHRDLHVLATTRSVERFPIIEALGAEPIIDTETLAADIRKIHPEGIDVVTDIVGATTIADSLAAVRYGGRVALAGFLGGGSSISLDILNEMPSGVQLSFFASAFTFGTSLFPLSEVPFQDFVVAAKSGAYRAAPAHVFEFDDIVRAHELMDSGKAQGKIVVRLP